ncbi:MAG: DUF1974 domain-containing protein, partial [Betaproteobacteria bacterium]|nr:DUF1974 domain-containing protein [Betaproteobacteria bacterium]
LCAQYLLAPSAGRDRLTEGMFLSKSEEDPTGQLEAAFLATIACEPIDKKLREAVKDGKLDRRMQEDLSTLARDKGILTAEEYALWQRKETLRKAVIKVDDFPQDFGRAELAAKLEASKPAIARAA